MLAYFKMCIVIFLRTRSILYVIEKQISKLKILRIMSDRFIFYCNRSKTPDVMRMGLNLAFSDYFSRLRTPFGSAFEIKLTCEEIEDNEYLNENLHANVGTNCKLVVLRNVTRAIAEYSHMFIMHKLYEKGLCGNICQIMAADEYNLFIDRFPSSPMIFCTLYIYVTRIG